MFSGLDLVVHRRLLLSIAIGAALSSLIWWLAFPMGYWFLKLWGGTTTGAFLGLILGAIWQVRDASRRSRTSGKLLVQGLVGLGIFSAVSVGMLAPMMVLQEREVLMLRTLDPARISEARLEGRRLDRKKLDEFLRLAKDAEVFHPDHEGTLQRFTLTLIRQGEAPREYEGRIPTKHTNDIALQFRTGAILSEILIKGGRKWLESVFNGG